VGRGDEVGVKRFWEFILDAFETSIFMRLLLLAVAVVAGLGSGYVSVAAGILANHGVLPDVEHSYATAPLLRLAFYATVGVAGYGGYQVLVHPEDSDTKHWAAVIGGLAMMTMVPLSVRFSSYPLFLGGAWGCCLVLLGMAGAGLWVIRAWRMNRWAAELHEIEVENAARRAGNAAALESGDDWN
jgi:hypothetical protein